MLLGLVALNTKGLGGAYGAIVFRWCDCVQVVGLYLGDPYDRRNSLTVNDLGRLARRKSLILNDLDH